MSVRRIQNRRTISTNSPEDIQKLTPVHLPFLSASFLLSTSGAVRSTIFARLTKTYTSSIPLNNSNLTASVSLFHFHQRGRTVNDFIQTDHEFTPTPPSFAASANQDPPFPSKNWLRPLTLSFPASRQTVKHNPSHRAPPRI